MNVQMRNLFISLIVPLIIIVVKPFNLSFNQAMVLATLVLTITLWVNGAVHKTLVSLMALLLFFTFGHPPIQRLLQFPLSENFILIVFAFVFSQGIANSGLPEVLIEPFLFRRATTKYRLLFIIFLLAFLMIFVIPQPFSRVIILSHIFSRYYEKLKLPAAVQEPLIFAVFLFSMFINMTMIRGDIILNNALITMSGQHINELMWLKIMFPPTLVYCLLGLLLFGFIFHAELTTYQKISAAFSHQAHTGITTSQKKYLIVLVLMLIIWATEDFHGISGTYVVIISTLLMFPMGLLHKDDLKSVNGHLLIFLTAAFAIGPVMTVSGLADILFSGFIHIFPETFNTVYQAAVLFVTGLLHMVLGSNITTMSVALPGLMTVSSGIASPIVMMFLIFITVCGHFILPFHNVILLIGNGSGLYDAKPVVKYGLWLLPVMVLAAFLIYLPWWHLVL
ncbi:anion permease [Fusibacter paucivorans]|uniref:Anion permease n=1 Tax=Fusibacter paucivorans TaxID=76009 RepID=A0ABS5PRN7_9FIRM|nr:SLC13 family permease [Fusibacter paucivorans]MBS7526727.1 anion permease [Fusibacter paucivorans]